jgi:CubicO group peptidase (beta-lactamase class C family)
MQMKSYFNRIIAALALIALMAACTQPADNGTSLPRSTPAAENVSPEAIDKYLASVKEANEDIHSIMILRHGKVVAEHWFGDNAPDKLHVLWSVSKTFTATAIGFAVAEGRLKLSDKVIGFFPDKLPAEVSENLQALTVKDLLTMSGGHDVEPTAPRDKPDIDWVEGFLAAPFVHKPGTFFVYNSVGTYMLSAIIQKATGEKLLDYLTPRLFEPLGISGATWDDSPQGINLGGWGLSLKTEDLAKMGLFILQKGEWKGKQLLPAAWFDEATAAQVSSMPSGMRPEQITPDMKQQDWILGYGYQMWRSRHNSFRADGAFGQYILVLPEQDAVIAVTARVDDMQEELNRIWEYLLPSFL